MKTALAVLAFVALSGCALEETRPIPPEVRTTVVSAPAPVVAPCFTEAERPRIPKPTLATEAEILAASPQQLLDAQRADELAMQVYSDDVDALFLKCQRKGVSQ